MSKPLSIFIILLVLMSSVAPVLAANEKIAKEPVKSSKAISKAPAELKDKIKAESTKADAIEITKDKSGIRMKADLPKGQDKVEITLSKDVIKEIPTCNGEYFYAHHFLDDGTYDGYQKVYVNKAGDTVFTAEFSETILNGFSGIYQVTLENQDISDLTIPMPDIDFDSISVSVPGAVSGQVIEEGNLTTYPSYENMVAGYDFDGDSVDFSGNGNNGTDTNVTYSDSAAEFNGIDSGIDVLNSAELSNNDTFSISFWMKCPDQDGYGRILQYGHNYYIYKQNGSDYINMRTYDGGTVGSNIISGVFDNEWHHCVMTFDRGVAQKGYLDGELKSTDTSLPTGDITTTDDMSIGYANKGTHYLQGQIREIVIYDTVLYQSDITNLYTSVNGTSLQLLNNSFLAYDGSDFTTSGNYHSSGLRLVTASEEPVYSDVTITGYFSEDTTLIEETESDGVVEISINHAAGSNATAGYIEYEPTISPLYEMSMNSTNPNASYVYDSGLINISTGALSTGDNYYYNFTAQLTHSTYSVSGYVLDVSDDTPISNARVYSPSLGNVYTNASGYYEYPNVLNGNYTLTAYNSEYIENSTLVEVSGTDLTNQNILLTFYTQDMQDADNWDLVSTLIWIALFIVSIGFIFQVFRNGTFSMIPFDMIIKMLWILIITAIVYILVVYLSDTI